MSVVLGLPKKLLPSPEASLSEGCTSQWVKIQPNNVASVVNNSYNGFTVSTDTTTIPMVSQEVRFSVPVGMGKNVWLDTSKTTLSFRVNYEITSASATSGTTAFASFLQGSAMSFWDRLQVLNSNGVAIDDVNGLASIELHKQNWTFDSAERDSVGLAYGFRSENSSSDSANYLQGHKIDSLTSTGALLPVRNCFYSYEMPLPSSFLGAGAKGFVPIGALQRLDVYLTTASIVPISCSVASNLTTAPTLKITIDNISINAYYITLDDKSSALLGSPKIHYLHGVTNRSSTATIPAQSSGLQSILIGLRGQSVRSLATRFYDQSKTTSGSVNGQFDSKAPLCSQLNYFLQGKDRVPPNPHNTNNAIATVFMRALQASEAFNSKDFRYGGDNESFAKYLNVTTAPTSATGFDQTVVNASNTTSLASLASFTFAEDLRKASTSAILDGYNLSQSANNYLEMNITNASTSGNNTNVIFIASMDIIYLIDMEQGTVDFRV
jgi:hypothetical protein